MTTAERQLSRLGFGEQISKPQCWRVARIDEPLSGDAGVAPEHSRALRHWRMLLAEDPRNSPYRISRLDD